LQYKDTTNVIKSRKLKIINLRATKLLKIVSQNLQYNNKIQDKNCFSRILRIRPKQDPIFNNISREESKIGLEKHSTFYVHADNKLS